MIYFSAKLTKKKLWTCSISAQTYTNIFWYFSFIYNFLFFSGADTALSTELSQVYAQLEHIEADKAPARASIILMGLGFTSEMQARATKTFSGGWRMRLALARALFSK